MHKVIIKDTSWVVGTSTSYMEQDAYELTLGEADLKDHYSLVDPLFKIPELEDIGFNYLASTNEVLDFYDQIPRPSKPKLREEVYPKQILLLKGNLEYGKLIIITFPNYVIFTLTLSYPNPATSKLEDYEINKRLEGRLLVKEVLKILQDRIREKIPELINFKFSNYILKYEY